MKGYIIFVYRKFSSSVFFFLGRSKSLFPLLLQIFANWKTTETRQIEQFKKALYIIVACPIRVSVIFVIVNHVRSKSLLSLDFILYIEISFSFVFIDSSYLFFCFCGSLLFC